MTLEQMTRLGRKLTSFLALFADCFGRRDARALLKIYVQGQLSNVHRKTAEAIALQFGKAPRTLQRFLELIKWNEEKLRDRCQQIVARDHAHPEAIGCVDESGVSKSGGKTVGAGRQYNGSRGKVDNCVVGVHLGYSAPGFQVLLDSSVYLPEDWANDPARRKNIRARRDRVPHQAADRSGAGRSRAGQRDLRVGLDVRRVLWPRQQVSRRARSMRPGVCGRDPQRLSRLGAKTDRLANRPEKVGKTRAKKALSTRGSTPAVLRSPQLVEVPARLPRTVVAAIPDQGRRAWSRGVGSQMGRLVAEECRGLAHAAALLDGGSQRVERRSEILLVQPRAGGAQSGNGPVRHAAVAAASGLWTVVHRKLLSPRQGRTGAGSLRSAWLALRAPALLRHPIEPSVLRASAAGVRRGPQRQGRSALRGASSQRHERMAGLGRVAAQVPTSAPARRNRRSNNTASGATSRPARRTRRRDDAGWPRWESTPTGSKSCLDPKDNQ